VYRIVPQRKKTFYILEAARYNGATQNLRFSQQMLFKKDVKMKSLILVLAATLGMSAIARADGTTAAEKAMSFLSQGDNRGVGCTLNYFVAADGSGANLSVTMADDSATNIDNIDVGFGANVQNTVFAQNSNGFTVTVVEIDQNQMAEDGNRDYLRNTQVIAYDSASQTFTLNQVVVESTDAASKKVIRNGVYTKGPKSCKLGFAQQG
jgi:hypothetical protein